MITKNNIHIEILDKDQIYMVDLYCQLHFGKWIENRRSQFETKTTNPNFIGILGEWAFQKRLDSDVALSEYLHKRQLGRADRGDFVIHKALWEDIIDVKTQVCNYNPIHLLHKPDFLANIEAKHLKKDFITDFVFCTYQPSESRIYLMGQMSKEDLKRHAELHERDEEMQHITFKAETYTIPYRYLEPI